MRAPTILHLLPLLAMVSAECNVTDTGNASDTNECKDDVVDIYTILAVIFLSCLGLLLLVRIFLYFVSFGAVREITTTSTSPVIRIEGTGTCNVPKEEKA